MKHNFKVTIPMAIFITLIAVIYQRGTGPTYPKRVTIEVSQDTTLHIKLPRSHGGETNAPLEIPKIEKNMSGTITYKRYPTNDEWKTENLKDEGNRLTFELPHQPPAGKITYFLNVNINGKNHELASKDDPVFIRFKGEVPIYILAPHIFFMFLSMLFSALAIFEAVYKTESYEKIGRITLVCLMFGGMFLGPLVQKHAFGVYWAGFPYDWDLTDNKLLIGVIGWMLGVGLTYFLKKRWPVIMAAILLIVVYSIPHSMKGSQFNYQKGEVQTVKN